MMNLVVIFFSFVLVNNFILSKFMGLCPFIGVSRNRESAVGMGFAVIFVMSITSVLTWVIYHGILAPLGIEFLKTIVFILVIASLVQLVELVIRKFSDHDKLCGFGNRHYRGRRKLWTSGVACGRNVRRDRISDGSDHHVVFKGEAFIGEGAGTL